MIYRMLVESSVGAEAAQESDNFLMNDQFVVPESRLLICRKVALFILTFERFIWLISDQIILIFTTLSSLHLDILQTLLVVSSSQTGLAGYPQDPRW